MPVLRLLLSTTAGFALLAGCGKKPPAAAAPPEVGVVQVVQRDLPIYAEAVATVSGFIDAEIRARVPGFLEKQLYEDGAVVKEGQVLFTLEKTDYAAAVATAQATLTRALASQEKSKPSLERNRQLAKEGVVSQQELEDAEAQDRDAGGSVAQARAQLRQAQLNLSYTDVRSPIDGVAGLALVRLGNLVGQDSPTLLTTVSQIDVIRVNFPLSEVDYVLAPDQVKKLSHRNASWARAQFARLERGEATDDGETGLELVLIDGKPYPHRGVVVAANRQVDATTGTIQLQALFPNPDRLLRPGQYGRVRMRNEQVSGGALVVPERSLSQIQGTYPLAVVGPDDKVQLRPVKVGPSAAGLRIVTEGVKAGDRVVVDGLQKARDGVKVVPREAPTASLGPAPSSPLVAGALDGMPHFFIRRPIVAMVIAILTVLIGAVSLLGLPIAQFPQILPPQINLTTTYTGADALTIEQSVATPIEQQMNGVDQMLYIQSTNANDGTMTQAVTFDVGTNIDIDNVLVQNRFSQAQTLLPQDVKNFGVTIKKSLAFPLIVVSLYSPDGRYDATFLGQLRHHQHQRRAAAHRGRRRHPQPRRVGLRDAHLAQARRARPPRPDRHRRAERDARAERGQPGRPGRRRAGAAPASSSRTPCAPRDGSATPEEFGDDRSCAQNPDGSLVRVRDVATHRAGHR